jgi:hypothetical protein
MAEENERRSSRRHLACIPAHVAKKDGDPQLSVIRELSVDGAQLLTNVHPEIGAEMDLRLYIHLDQPEHSEHVFAHVVRVEKRPLGDFWPYLVAVKFEKALVGLDREIAELAAHQASLFGTPSR